MKKRLFRYNLSSGEYDAMIAEQGEGCFLCKKKDVRLCVDHDHKTNKVRSLLCHRCNVLVGHVENNGISVIHQIFSYLKYHNSSINNTFERKKKGSNKDDFGIKKNQHRISIPEWAFSILDRIKDCNKGLSSSEICRKAISRLLSSSRGDFGPIPGGEKRKICVRFSEKEMASIKEWSCSNSESQDKSIGYACSRVLTIALLNLENEESVI